MRGRMKIKNFGVGQDFQECDGVASLRRQVLVEQNTKTNVGPMRERLLFIVIAVGGVFKSEGFI